MNTEDILIQKKKYEQLITKYDKIIILKKKLKKSRFGFIIAGLSITLGTTAFVSTLLPALKEVLTFISITVISTPILSGILYEVFKLNEIGIIEAPKDLFNQSLKVLEEQKDRCVEQLKQLDDKLSDLKLISLSEEDKIEIMNNSKEELERYKEQYTDAEKIDNFKEKTKRY